MRLGEVLRAGGAPMSSIRIVRERSPDHSGLAAVHRLLLDLTGRRLAPEDAPARLDRIPVAPRRCPRSGVTAAWAALASAVAPPSLSLIVPGVTPLLAGLAVDAVTLELAQGASLRGIAGLVGATTAVLALAAGILGDLIGRPRAALERVSWVRAG